MGREDHEWWQKEFETPAILIIIRTQKLSDSIGGDATITSGMLNMGAGTPSGSHRSSGSHRPGQQQSGSPPQAPAVAGGVLLLRTSARRRVEASWALWRNLCCHTVPARA